MAFIFFALVGFGIALAQNIDDPRFWAYPEFYDISSDDGTTKYECAKSDGSRCVFQSSQFEDIHYGTGQESVNYQSSVWAATTPDAVLTLTNCLLDGEPCKVTCNANCTCTINSTNKPCVEGVSSAPTPVPVGDPEASSVCPNITNAQHCPQLMQHNLPMGQAGLFDCYNFCGGKLVSTCSDGSCGSADCEDKGDDGSLMGIVTGCTAEHLDVQIAKPVPASSAGRPSMVLFIGFLALAL